jgi:cation-transporting P-type ATPase D
MFSMGEVSSYQVIIAVCLLLIPLLLYILRRKKNKKNGCEISYNIIDNLEKLQQVCKLIIEHNALSIGLDTEYYRGSLYKGRLCIFQVSFYLTDNSLNTYIIDLLKFEKQIICDTIGQILSNEKIEKVIHACYNDIEWIYDEFGIVVNNILDTQNLYNFLNGKKTKSGLNDLINEFFNVKMDKQIKIYFQKSNWLHRPLTKEQLQYAATDSYYLIGLKNKMKDKLNMSEKGYEILKSEHEERLKTKYVNIDKFDRIEGRALGFLLSNLVKCENILLEKIKKIFLNLFRLNENTAVRFNVDPESILSLKTIYKLSVKLPKLREEMFNEIKKHNHSTLSNMNYTTLLEDVFNLLQQNSYESTCIIEKYAQINNNDDNKEVVQSQKDKSKQAHIAKIERKQQMRSLIIKKFSCKKPVYENCKMLAPDGEQLSFCDTKKMKWYLERGLAEQICEEPPTFRLKFEPNARGCSDIGGIPSNFYVKYRKNCCVVCGKENDYMRFHVVPILYRQFFPTNLKSHKSHDVVLLCFNCHEKANKIYNHQKRIISKQYNIPFESLSSDQAEYKNLANIIRISNTVHKNFNKMPEDRREDMIKQLQDFLETSKDNDNYFEFFSSVFYDNKRDIPKTIEDFSKDLLFEIKSFKLTNTHGERKNHHGKLIVDEIKDLQEFIKEWRKFFKDTLNPQFLPDSWNVEHEFVRTFGEHSKFNPKFT